MPAPIVAFAKDWHEDPTSNHHVLRELAKTRRVLWLNSIATRAPSLSSGRDLGKIRRKLGEFARGPQNVENDLWVMSPLVVPLPHSAAARAANREILRATIRMARLRLGIKDFHLWTFLPTVGDYVGTLGESFSVYYCVDEWSMFGYLNREQTVAAERQLLGKVDCVFAINEALASTKRAVHPHVYLAPHGVDHAQFARALEPSTVIPADLAALPRPRIGFYGTLRDWVDLDLIAYLAKARPQWSIALIGQALDDLGPIKGLPNVHLLGQKKHDELPAYCKGFDVGLIPYRLNERMKYVNPLKLREYLSAGVPVVSTAVPEVLRYAHVAHVAHSPEEFLAATETALGEGGPAARAARSAAMRSETWAARVADVAATIERVEHGETEALSDRVPYLVTGANGHVGRAVVTRLLADGHRVRAFVRRLPEARVAGVEYAIGDLSDAAAVDRAVRGAETVIHAGAATRGGWAEHRASTVVGTGNIIASCRAHGVAQLVHISSMSVVDWAGSSVVDEHAALEPRSEERGAYTRAKLEAELLVAGSGLPCVILRPGQIFGGGIAVINGAVARAAAGRWLVLGDGTLELPLVYLDDVVDAIVAAVVAKVVHGEVIQLVDPERLTQDEVLAIAGGDKPVVRVPRPLVFALGKLSELPLGAVGKQSPVALYRLKSALARLHYESDRAHTLLGWHPRVGVREGIRRMHPLT
jgi:nucleoside-diphosphate-sugar epimerase/glycosyltransferase involved in cell wall biosynthesis